MQLLCPKCHNVMNRYERNNVTVDQCAGCGGLFLDRGELEHLIQAEAAYYAAPGAPTPARPEPMRDAEPRYSEPRYGDDLRYRDRDGSSDRVDFRDRHDSRDRDAPSHSPRFKDEKEYKAYKRKKKARSFLDDLLDF